jgi:formate/nitrite transporter FocA (FNT family)
VPSVARRVQAGAYNLRMDPLRLLVIAVLVAIVASLGTALYHLATGKGDSSKMVRSLTLRVALSVALFLLLMIAWRLGWIHPHGLDR